MPRKPHAAIGFKAHTGWAAAVVVAQAGEEIEVLAKRRITMQQTFAEGAVYHVGHEGGLTPAQAQPIIDACLRTSVERARKEIAALIASAGCEVHRAAVVARAGKPLPPLESILRSHPLVHAAEGELYRAAIAAACEAIGLRVARVSKPSGERSILARLAEAGKASGKPWAAEQRECALAALAVL